MPTLRLLTILASFLFVVNLHAQHDGARDAVRHIADGNFDQVTKTLDKKKPFAGEAESAFVEMLSLLAQDKPADALKQAKKAVELGLPMERLIVGPREQLANLHVLPEFQAWEAKAKPSLLIHGPMLGNVSSSSADVWVRTAKAANVEVKLAGVASVSQSQRTSEATDFTTRLALTGLQPSTEYSYAVEVDGTPLATGVLRTFPEKAAGAKFSVGFGGGAGYVPEWEYMWNTIAGFKPNAMLMLGDNVYIDQPEQSMTNQYCYYRRQSRPEWKRFTAVTPIFSIWDDHDFGTNDCVPGPSIEKPAWKREVFNIFRQNWANPAYGGGAAQPGCWYDFHIGDVHFMMLDGRYYRDLKGGTMLGPIQKQWLFKTLKDSTATFKVIASPVPFTAGIKKGSRDPWDGFPEEREDIFRYIESEKIEGLFLIAADRHRTDLRITKRADGYDLYEFESSRLTNHHTHPVVKTDGLVWGYNKTCSFALMEFDTTADDPRVTFKCISIDGDVKETFDLRRSMLKFP